MDYSKIPIGVELYTVREDFEAKPADTLRRLKEIRYDGVEFFGNIYEKDPIFLKELLCENELDCYGILTGWNNLQPENIGRTLEFNRKLGNSSIAVGSLSKEQTKDKASLYECISYFNRLLEELTAEGFSMGYHNHDTDFALVDGKTIWDHIFENTPQEFKMVLDTGNAVAGGGDPIGIIRKYPARQEWMHIKPYSKTNYWMTGYDAMIGEDDFDWETLIRTCVEVGGTKVLTIEYGNRNRYQPFYGAYLCYTKLKDIVNNM